MDGPIGTTLPAPPVLPNTTVEPREPVVTSSDLSSPPRVRVPVQLSREQILEATAQCLHESGYDKTTIRRIAAILGCAVGSIYRYFKDKRQLLDAVTQQRLEPAVKLVEAGASFEISVREYHRCVTRGMQEYQLMFWLASVGYQATMQGDAPPLPQIVRRIIDGWTRQLDDTAAATQAWVLLHGSIMLGRTADQTVSAIKRVTVGASSTDEHAHGPVTPRPISPPKEPEDIYLL